MVMSTVEIGGRNVGRFLKTSLEIIRKISLKNKKNNSPFFIIGKLKK